MKEEQNNWFNRFLNRIKGWFAKSSLEKPVSEIRVGDLKGDFVSRRSRYSYRSRYLRYLFGHAINSYNNCHKGCRKLLKKMLKDKFKLVESFEELGRDEVLCEILDEIFSEHEWEDFSKISKELVRFENDLAFDIVKRSIHKGTMISHPLLIDMLMEKHKEYGALTTKEECELYRIVDNVITSNIDRIKDLSKDQLLELIRVPIVKKYNKLSAETSSPITKKMYDLKAKRLDLAA